MNPTSHLLDAHGHSIHALERNPSGDPVVLFLHGWLDHCHSFDWLCAALPASWRMIALDFRGHGRSAHLPSGGHYHWTDYLADVDGTLNALGVSSVHLVGHSMGGAIALMYAAARPERAQSVVTIESLGPLGAASEEAADRLSRFVQDLAKPALRRTYPSVEAAAQRVQENNSSLSPEAAALLARHGTQAVAGGVAFTFDSALRRASAFSFDEAQVHCVFEAVKAPVLVVHGSHGLSFTDAQMKARLARLKVEGPIEVPGGHHLHLDQPAEVAGHLARFISSLG